MIKILLTEITVSQNPFDIFVFLVHSTPILVFYVFSLLNIVCDYGPSA